MHDFYKLQYSERLLPQQITLVEGVCWMGNTDNGYKMMEVKTETFPLYLTGSISPSVASRYSGL